MSQETPKSGSSRERTEYVDSGKENIRVVKNREEAITEIKTTIRQLLEKRFGPEGETPLPFHRPKHSYEVAKLTKEFLEIIKGIDPTLLTDWDLELAEIEALSHDLRQDAIILKGKQRKRKRGAAIGNENASAQELLALFKKYVDQKSKPIFPTEKPATEHETATLYEAVINDIGATFPDDTVAKLPKSTSGSKTFPGGTPGLKISQPHLVKQSSLRALALASADLRGVVGASNFEVFRREGDAEFRELQEPIKNDLEGGISNISPERRAKIAAEILGWKKTQIAFAQWQEILFLESLDENQILRGSQKFEEIKKALKERYSRFKDNIAAAENLYQELEQKYGRLRQPATKKELMDSGDESFIDLLREVGYIL